MKVEFSSFELSKVVNGGLESVILKLTTENIVSKLFSLYKDRRGIHQKYDIIKRSEFNDDSKFGINDIPNGGLPEYFWIKQGYKSTPHGSIKEIFYREKGTEQDYKVYKALMVIKDLIEDN